MERNNDIAIIGLSGVFPASQSLEQFYHHLKSGNDLVRKISATRIINSSLSNHTNYQVSGHLDRVDTFDHKFFGISKKEAELMDPVQRILLELVCTAIENAGYSLTSFNGSNTALYLGGNPYTNYHSIIEEADPLIYTGNLHSIAAGRISYLLNLQGPSIMLDTACSASLVAVHEACQKLISHEVDYALAGGIHINTEFADVNTFIDLLGIVSPTGKSRTFDAGANGTGGGEGGAIILLKRFSDAVADRDHIHAVIKGTAVNHDGSRSNGLTAPSPVAQSEVICKAWEQAAVDPETITFIEAHGTGTKLGDPIEFQGITDAFNRHTSLRKFCAVGSVKSNVGHLNNAAGIIGLLKCVLSLEKKELFPSLHFDTPNPYIDFENTAAFVLTKCTPWESPDSPRRCGVSSFGFSGTNVHAVLQEAPVVTLSNDRPYDELILKISAKSPDVLAAYLDHIYSSLVDNHDDICNIIYTLTTGRNDYPYRISVTGRNRTQIVENLGTIKKTMTVSESPLQPVANREMVLLLSDPCFDTNELTFLRSSHSLFEKVYSKLMLSRKNTEPNEDLEKFIYQYSLFRLFESFGLTYKTIIGTGIGRITKQVVTGLLLVEDAVIHLETSKASFPPFDKKKFDKVIRGMDVTIPTVFIELGSKGVLSSGLQSMYLPWNFMVYCFVDPQQKVSCLARVGDLYTKGITVHWEAIYSLGHHFRVPAPTYPFQKIRCWAKAPTKLVDIDYEKWLYQIAWKSDVDHPMVSEFVNKKILLIAAPEDCLVHEMLKVLEGKNNTCIHVELSNVFEELVHKITLNKKKEEDYGLLALHLEQRKFRPDAIIHLSGCKKSNETAIDDLLFNGIYSQFFTSKAFNSYLSSPGFTFVVLTTSSNRIFEVDHVEPVAAMSFAFLKGILAEYPSLNAHTIEVDVEHEAPAIVSAYVVRELCIDSHLRFVSYRTGVRYIPLLHIRVDQDSRKEAMELTDKGTYLITGGAKGIGFEIAKSVAEQTQGHLIILGRTILPPQDEWQQLVTGVHSQNPVIPLVNNLLELIRIGATMDYFSTDIGNELTLSEVFKAISQRVTKLDGVIHCAGLPGNLCEIRKLSFDDFVATLDPKVKGTILLENFTRALHPNFFLLFSSLNAIVPQRNTVDYTLANAFQDAFATVKRTALTVFEAINWPGWNIGMSAEYYKDRPLDVNVLSSTEGVHVFNKILSLPVKNTIVSKYDLFRFQVNPYFAVSESKECVSANDIAVLPKAKMFEPLTVEDEVLLILTEILKAESISIEDDFFAIGGHSLNAVQVINRFKRDFGVEVGFDDLLEYATIAELCVFIRSQMHGETAMADSTIPKIAEQTTYEASHAQRRLWFLDQKTKGNLAFNMSGAYVLHGALDLILFQRSFDCLIERHESLRTVFVNVEGEPRQCILRNLSEASIVEYIDLCHYADPKEEAKKYVEQQCAMPFDLSSGPLIKAKLLRIAEQQHVFLLGLHHIICDGWSMDIIVNEFNILYQAFNKELRNPLKDLPIQYKDFAAWQNVNLNYESSKAHRNYWKERLSKLSYITMPTDHRRPKTRTYEGDYISLELSTSTVDRLTAMASGNSTTVFTILLTCLKILFFRYTGQRNIVLGTPVAGRSHRDLENQVGFYINTLLIHTTLQEEERFMDLLKRVNRQVLEDFNHQIYPYDLIVEDLSLKPDAYGLSFLDYGFTWNKSVALDKADVPFVVEPFFVGQKSSRADLWVFGTEIEQRIFLKFEYNTDLFKRSTVQLFIDRFNLIIENIIDHPDIPVEEINFSVHRDDVAEVALEKIFNNSF